MGKSGIPKKKITFSEIREALRLYKYIKPYGGKYILGLFFLFGSSLTNLAFPKLLGDLLIRVMPGIWLQILTV